MLVFRPGYVRHTTHRALSLSLSFRSKFSKIYFDYFSLLDFDTKTTRKREREIEIHRLDEHFLIFIHLKFLTLLYGRFTTTTRFNDCFIMFHYSNMTNQTFVKTTPSFMMNNSNYHPSRETIFDPFHYEFDAETMIEPFTYFQSVITFHS